MNIFQDFLLLFFTSDVIPSDFQELKEYTKISYFNGFECYKFQAKNGNYIVIPRAGYCSDEGRYGLNQMTCLWTSSITIYPENMEIAYGRYVGINSTISFNLSEATTLLGFTIRPVI